ncbi:MAG: sigma-70 family RNA polymerase sigma factor [Acidimicrobiales bacterium]
MAVRRDTIAVGDGVVGVGGVGFDPEDYRRQLTGYCYRMLGSSSDADDAVQETMVRAWKAGDGFEGRSAPRSWLYRIATNVCLDQLLSSQRRARPMEMGPSRPPVESSLETMLPEGSWVSPIADDRVLPVEADPAEVAALRDSIRLAFVAALQHLPARQRSVLILCQVLRWQASEVAELLGTTVAAVNSALQRARATLASVDASSPAPAAAPAAAVDADQDDLLNRFVDAFQRYDIEQLVSLLHDDAVQSMPPFAMWMQGPADIARFLVGPGHACRGSVLIPVPANGSPAFGHYKPDPQGGLMPWALMVIETSGNRVSGIHSFLNPEDLFPDFGLPAHLPA